MSTSLYLSVEMKRFLIAPSRSINKDVPNPPPVHFFRKITTAHSIQIWIRPNACAAANSSINTPIYNHKRQLQPYRHWCHRSHPPRLSKCTVQRTLFLHHHTHDVAQITSVCLLVSLGRCHRQYDHRRFRQFCHSMVGLSCGSYVFFGILWNNVRAFERTDIFGCLFYLASKTAHYMLSMKE